MILWSKSRLFGEERNDKIFTVFFFEKLMRVKYDWSGIFNFFVICGIIGSCNCLHNVSNASIFIRFGEINEWISGLLQLSFKLWKVSALNFFAILRAYTLAEKLI